MNSSFIKGHCTIHFIGLLNDQDHINLDLEGLQVDSIRSNSELLNFQHSGSQLLVMLSTPLEQGDIQTIEVHYHGNPMQDTIWGGYYFANGYAYNLGVGFASEPHNYGRVWHPCFDNFVEKATYQFDVLTNLGRTAYCNGMRTSVENVGQDSLLTHWAMDFPIPSYLASVHVANYVHAESTYVNAENVALPIYLTAKAQDTTNMKLSMVNLPPWLQYAEEKYGPYQWPRIGYCAVPFNGGAMEHATNIAYPLFAIDGGLDNEALMAHEISHHWWGNLVTCETAGDMWINEGMASYSEALFMEGIYGTQAYKNYVRDNFKNVLTRAHRNDGGYFALAEIPSALTYGDHVYNKGALIAHNLRGQIGDYDFFNNIQQLMSGYQYNHISTLDLRDYWQTLSIQDINGFFENWILQPGLPEFRLISAIPFGSNQWHLQFEQHAHHTSYPLENVWMRLTAVNAAGEKWHHDFLLGPGITNSYITLPAEFEAVHFYLNDDERLHDACLPEEKWIQTNASHDLDFAEMDLDVLDLGSNDSIWVRVENHWAAVDEMQQTTGYLLSTDRWWNVMIVSDGSENLAADIRYYGDNNQTNFFDPTFFETIFAAGMNEDSLVLMYRPHPMQPWTEWADVDVITTPGLLNGIGRMHINQLQTGQYCWAVRDPSNVQLEAPVPALQFEQRGLVMHISAPHQVAIIDVFDAMGKVVHNINFMDHTQIDMTPWAKGAYTFVCRSQANATHKAIRP
jgi:hypothetical protein